MKNQPSMCFELDQILYSNSLADVSQWHDAALNEAGRQGSLPVIEKKTPRVRPYRAGTRAIRSRYPRDD